MNKDREKVLRMALDSVLNAAQDQDVHIEKLCEAAIQSMLDD